MRRSDDPSLTDDTSAASVEPIVSTIRVANGVALEDAAPFAAVLAPSTRIARGRQDEQLLFFFHPVGAENADLCGALRGVVTQVYWSTAGSVTAALRRAASAANRYLFEHNLNADPSDRCYGGLSCAVLRRRDLFLLHTGPAWACILQSGELNCFPREGKPAYLGIGPMTDARLTHVSTAPGDTLLLASLALLRAAGDQGLLRVLPREEIGGVVAGLRELGSQTDFTALVVRWESARAVEASQAGALPQARRSGLPVSGSKVSAEPRAAPESMDQGPEAAALGTGRLERVLEQPPPLQGARKLAGALALSARQKLASALRGAAGGLSYLWHAFAALGAGMAALGGWLIGAIGTTARSMLPGSQREGSRRADLRPPPQENPTILMLVAVAIPILVLVVVTVAYVQLAARSRFEGAIRQAEQHIALAQAAGTGSEEARAHWEEALQYIQTAAALQPDEPSTRGLREQAQDALDRVDAVERLTLTQLADFGSSNEGRRLTLGGQALFVLDSSDGWSARVSLDPIDDGLDSGSGLVLVRTGQQIEGRRVARLVDCVWVRREGGRQSSALLVLEEDGGLLTYDPAWETEGGAPQLARLQLSTPSPARPLAVGSYQGQFYILDAVAENGGQIWRYRPLGNAYPEPPEPYFPVPPERGLGEAVDMAIDGYIYILYDDGTVDKFLGGQLVELDVRDVPGGIGEVSGFAVDPIGSGTVYLADRGKGRVIELHPDGRFKAQLRVDEGFESLEALAVSEADGQLYILDAGRLYVAPLP